MMPQLPDPKSFIPSDALPEAVRDLYCASNRPVIDPKYLFFREARPTFSVPEFTTRDRHDSWGPFALEHRIFYLWQGDGSLAVYAYLFDGSHAAGRSYGCLYVGCARREDWTLGGVE
jgi:hypothetical protein